MQIEDIIMNGETLLILRLINILPVIYPGINPGILHAENYSRSGAEGERFRLYSCAIEGFETGIMPPNHLLPQGITPVLRSGKLEERFRAVFSEICREHMAGARWYTQICNDLSQEIVLLVLRLLHEKYGLELPAWDESSMERIRRWVETHYTEKINIETMADELGLSRHSIQRTVREKQGVTFTQYINRERVEEARRLMEHSKLSLEDIAFRCGFQNYSWFQAQFKRFTGRSPGEVKI
jgi:AraC-like DNA-binding protein